MKTIFNKKRRKRTASLKNKAYQLGMPFKEKEDFSSVNLLKDMILFNVGINRTISNIFSEAGNDIDESIRIFDYLYIIHTGQATVPILQTVFQVKSKELDLPHFRIKPKNMLQRFGSKLGMYKKKILFEHRSFNNRFLIKTKEPNRLVDSLPPALIELMVQDGKLWIEGINYFLAVYRIGKYLSAEQITRFRETGHYILELFKEHQK